MAGLAKEGGATATRAPVGRMASRSFEERLAEAAPSAPREDLSPEVSRFLREPWGELPVSVHRGGVAGGLLRAAGTPAAAVGAHVVLSPQAPQLATEDGRRLLAHEMAHVAQHQGAASGPHRTSSGHRAAEVAAHRAAERVMAGVEPGPLGPAPGPHFAGGGQVVVKVAERALKWLAKRGKNVSAHVARRHIANRVGKSTFKEGGKEVKKLLERTIKDADNVVDQGRRLVFEKQFGREVGQGGEKIVRVVVEKGSGKVVTAFPTAAFRTVTAVAAGSIASSAASTADAQILQRRKTIQEALKPGLLESVIDFLIGPSTVARDEDILAEERIIEQNIQQAITAIEQELQQSLDARGRAEVREMILIEMATEPTAG